MTIKNLFSIQCTGQVFLFHTMYKTILNLNRLVVTILNLECIINSNKLKYNIMENTILKTTNLEDEDFFTEWFIAETKLREENPELYNIDLEKLEEM